MDVIHKPPPKSPFRYLDPETTLQKTGYCLKFWGENQFSKGSLRLQVLQVPNQGVFLPPFARKLVLFPQKLAKSLPCAKLPRIRSFARRASKLTSFEFADRRVGSRLGEEQRKASWVKLLGRLEWLVGRVGLDGLGAFGASEWWFVSVFGVGNCPFQHLVGTRGLFLPLFCEIGRPPQKGILHYKGVDHFSTKAGKRTPLEPLSWGARIPKETTLLGGFEGAYRGPPLGASLYHVDTGPLELTLLTWPEYVFDLSFGIEFLCTCWC